MSDIEHVGEQKEARTILDALRADKRRDTYQADPKYTHGQMEFWITHQGGGPFRSQTVLALVESGLLKQKYQNCQCYTLP